MKERREIHTEDLARPSAADDRAVLDRDPVTGREEFSRPAEAVERTMLFRPEEAGQFRTRWSDGQGAFVDSPRSAVERADALVAETMKRARIAKSAKKHLRCLGVLRVLRGLRG
ncbi:MAG: hypothetical protein ACRD3G_02970 [Vicinamibacterales bacterium]